jgi:hypothetical protein
VADSPVRSIVGRALPDADPDRPAGPAPESLRELAFIDRINEAKAARCTRPARDYPTVILNLVPSAPVLGLTTRRI